ncbi:MAG TPA: SsrA-binding protein SmpB [candidate division WOR-3 bacterium]|uniref:SsrA-binding protein n=1 Tax=candidate division WOR-3 bacterium TaxID=2052148 RepID=A0A7V0T6M1_UNCW3|nr:SsrA-binding protein SmpB [candidate division WOR-3 bacterium]
MEDVTGVATNRKALRDYEVVERLEAGIELAGTEVKSLRGGNVSLDEGFARVENDQVWLYGVHIAPYLQGNIHNRDPRRRRKLLLHKREIQRLFGRATLRGLTLVPLRLYFNKRGYAKVELALCRGKKLYDRREDLRKRAMERDERLEQAKEIRGR